jgi:serine/threonine-protein kinase Chk1
MMSGLHYLHEKGYAHRDIKPENLLLSLDFKLKLTDFGFATLWKGKDGTGILHTKLGTEGYMAP